MSPHQYKKSKTPNRQNQKRKLPQHIIVKNIKYVEQRKNIESRKGEKPQVTYEGNPNPE